MPQRLRGSAASTHQSWWEILDTGSKDRLSFLGWLFPQGILEVGSWGQSSLRHRRKRRRRRGRWGSLLTHCLGRQGGMSFPRPVHPMKGNWA